jgi:hypothetical protein
LSLLAARAGKRRARTKRTGAAQADRPARELQALVKGLSKPQRLAMPVVAEEVPLGERIEFVKITAKQ